VALIFLTLFSSCIGYTAFTYLMPRVSPAKLGTYAYVNPLVATLVGWWLLGEELTAIQWVGGIIVLASVAVINLPGNGKGHSNGQSKGQSKPKTSGK
jgi:drug/metabolite transporter (DMT)-like permease